MFDKLKKEEPISFETNLRKACPALFKEWNFIEGSDDDEDDDDAKPPKDGDGDADDVGAGGPVPLAIGDDDGPKDDGPKDGPPEDADDDGPLMSILNGKSHKEPKHKANDILGGSDGPPHHKAPKHKGPPKHDDGMSSFMSKPDEDMGAPDMDGPAPDEDMGAPDMDGTPDIGAGPKPSSGNLRGKVSGIIQHMGDDEIHAVWQFILKHQRSASKAI